MREVGVGHYLIPSSDEHLNEYLPPRSMRREWMSGFTGSAGDLLVGIDPDETKLFADGRYHVQAESELEGSGIGLVRVGRPNVPTLGRYIEELSKRHGTSLRIGVDPFVIANSSFRNLGQQASGGGGALVALDHNLVDEIWTDRPRLERSVLYALDPSVTGSSAESRLAALRRDLERHGAAAFVAIKLDQIAWLLNLRSFSDVPFNPVFLAYLVVDSKRVLLHLAGRNERLPRDFEKGLPGLEVREYSDFADTLRTLEAPVISIDPDRTTAGVFALLSHRRLLEQMSSVESSKARKNPVEVSQMRLANLAASTAKTRAILWGRDAVDRGDVLTEASFKAHLEARYAELDGYRGLSFSTISAAGDHGALPHYHGADSTPLRDGEPFVIDSGIQWGAGTTDDTRTLGIGTPSAERKRIFTLVLKAHIQGAAALFPEGTAGASIDALVRNPMWSVGLDYGHGTGHGVGALLNVHEGPFQIGDLGRRPSTTLPLEPGMIMSIEPGYYRIGFGGVRHENLYLVVEHHVDDSGRRWLAFESLTYIPFDVKWIDFEALDPRERDWLDAYHAECVKRLGPSLSADELDSLRRYLDTGR